MADTVFPVTLDDTSPTITYAPFADALSLPNLTAGWNSYYTVSGFSTDPGSSSSSSVVSNIGNGTSLHLTACDGAQFAIKWNGTAIEVYGTVTSPASTNSFSYSISLDGTSTTNYVSSLSSSSSVDTAATDILAAFSNLTDTSHEIVLTVHNPYASSGTDASGSDAVVAFDRAVVYMAVSGSQPTASSSTSPSATLTPTTFTVPDDSVAYHGQWSYSAGLLSDLPNEAFHTSGSVGDTARFDFNGTAVTLSGLTTPSSGTYNITLDNLEYPTLSARSSFTSSYPTVLFYAAGLDPSFIHALEIMNAGPSEGNDGEGLYLVVLAGGVNVTTVTTSSAATATSSSLPLSRGAIAAIAIGAILALIAVVALVFVLSLWRRRVIRRRDLLVNPEPNCWKVAWRRWFTPGSSQPHEREPVTEKEDAWGEQVVETRRAGVLEIGGEVNYQDKYEDGGEAARRVKGRSTPRTRHASQNSDGSFSIDLPELSSTPLAYPPASFPSTPQPLSLLSQISTLPRLTSSPTSPRNARPRGPREMHGRDSSRGILLSQAITPTSDVEEEEGLPSLRVEFANQEGRPDHRSERHISTGGFSLPQSLRQALSRTREAEGDEDPSAAGVSRPSTLFSFLDFSSSSSPSTSPGGRSRSARFSPSVSRSNSARSTRHSSRSRRNTGSERSVNSTAPPERRVSLGLSMTIGGGPTASRPSLTPDISLQAVPLPPPIIVPPDTHPHHISDRDRLQADPTGTLPSPTDSIPLTVSDIHFRHSVHSSASQGTESRRTSAFRNSGSHRLPHPPLPGATAPSTPTAPTMGTHTRDNSQVVRSNIVQRLMGIPAAGSSPSPPAATPTTAVEPRGSRPATVEAPSASGSPATPSFGQKSHGFGFGLGRLR